MKLRLVRYSLQKGSTLGVMLCDGEFLCYTLEDERRDVKIPGETCIPAGVFTIKLRTVGGFHGRYGAKFGGAHIGMLELQDVPGFQYILLHCGNDDGDTEGCILVGDTSTENLTRSGFIGSSVSAYTRIYPKLAEAAQLGLLSIVIEELHG